MPAAVIHSSRHHVAPKILSNTTLTKRKVRLPAGETITSAQLADAIASYVAPPRATLVGMECVARWSKPFPSEDGSALAGFHAARNLTAEEFELFAKQLSRLPKLHGRMSEDEKEDFLRRFKELNPSQDWTPVLRIGRDTPAEHELRSNISSQHRKKINEKVASGELTSIQKSQSENGQWVHILLINQAQEYLRGHGYPCTQDFHAKESALQSSLGKPTHRNYLDEVVEEAIELARRIFHIDPVWRALVEIAATEHGELYLDESDRKSLKGPVEQQTISIVGQSKKLKRELIRGRLRTRKKNLMCE